MHGLGFDDSPIEMIHEDMEHGGHSISWSEASVQNTCKIMKDKGNEICITTICPQDKNIKDCLLKQEAYAKMNNKSLLILTGQMMRLGVSLPCVDIAIHMDPINSVDTIYQSMFRVLTERPGKDKGIFIDILTKRNIKFIYDMVDYNIDKKIPTIDYKKKEIFDKNMPPTLLSLMIFSKKKLNRKDIAKLTNNDLLNCFIDEFFMKDRQFVHSYFNYFDDIFGNESELKIEDFEDDQHEFALLHALDELKEAILFGVLLSAWPGHLHLFGMACTAVLQLP